MKTFLFITTMLAIFAAIYVPVYWLLERYLWKVHRRDTDKRIKDAMFNELGFTYRETATGKGYLIIDRYEGNRAVPL